MLCIQETKLQDLQEVSCYNLWGDNNIDWLHKQAEGNSGGILTIWHKERFKYTRQVIGNLYVGVFGDFFRNTKENPISVVVFNVYSISVVVFNVYSSSVITEKEELWKDLTLIKAANVCKSWCILGDFNAVRKSSERKGLNSRGYTTKREVERFNNFIDTSELIDVPLIGESIHGIGTTEQLKAESTE